MISERAYSSIRVDVTNTPSRYRQTCGTNCAQNWNFDAQIGLYRNFTLFGFFDSELQRFEYLFFAYIWLEVAAAVKHFPVKCIVNAKFWKRRDSPPNSSNNMEFLL